MPGAADLDLGPVDAQVDTLSFGVGEQVLQGMEPQREPVGNGEPALGEQCPYLPHGGGDGGTVHQVQLGQRRVGQLMAKAIQGEQQPVTEDQFRLAPGAGRPVASASAALGTVGLPDDLPARRRLEDELGKVVAYHAREGRMGQGSSKQATSHVS